MRFLLAAALLFILTACTADPRRDFKGTRVKPLWNIPNIAVSQDPVVQDGIIYVFASPAGVPAMKRNLYAFDLKTRKQLWNSNFVPLDKIKYFSGAALFVADDHGLGHTLDRKTGQELEPAKPLQMVKAVARDNIVYANFKDGTIASSAPGALTSTSSWTLKTDTHPNKYVEPVLHDETLYTFGDSAPESEISEGMTVYAIDAAKGKIRWQYEARAQNMRSRQMQADASTLYVTMELQTPEGKRLRRLTALDSSTGKAKWSADTGERFSLDQPLLLDPSTILLCDQFDNNTIIIRALDSATGKDLWRSQTIAKFGEWHIYEGALYFADRVDHSSLGMWLYPNTRGPKDTWIVRVDPRTGKEVWRSEVVEKATFMSPTFADGLVIVGSDPSGIYAYRP